MPRPTTPAWTRTSFAKRQPRYWFAMGGPGQWSATSSAEGLDNTPLRGYCYLYTPRDRTKTVSIRCGNKVHGHGVWHHETIVQVRLCYTRPIGLQTLEDIAEDEACL